MCTKIVGAFCLHMLLGVCLVKIKKFQRGTFWPLSYGCQDGPHNEFPLLNFIGKDSNTPSKDPWLVRPLHGAGFIWKFPSISTGQIQRCIYLQKGYI